MEAQITGAQALGLLQRQRHSFLNHLQVISGWLQLNRPDRAHQYVQAVAGRMAAEAEVGKQLSSAMALLVLELGMEAETYGVQVEWDLRGEAALADLPELRVKVSAALAVAATFPEDNRRITVVLGLDGALSVHTPIDKGEA